VFADLAKSFQKLPDLCTGLGQRFPIFFPMPLQVTSKILTALHAVIYKSHDLHEVNFVSTFDCQPEKKSKKIKFENLNTDLVSRPKFPP